MKTKLALAAVALSLAACNQSEQAKTPAADAAGPVAAAAVVATGAWCRPSPNGAKAGGCYVTLKATTNERLTGGSTPAAGSLQIHEMTMEGGMMKMGELTQGLPLPADQAVALAPGGNHLMLIGLTAPLVEGSTVPLTLQFASAPAVTVQAAVRQPEMAGMDHGAH